MGFIDKIRRFLSSDEEGATEEKELLNDFLLGVDSTGQATGKALQVAVLVLLIKLSGMDKGVDNSEAEAVTSLITKQFGLADDQMPSLVELAIDAQRHRGKIDHFVNAINGQFSTQQRERIYAMLWKVVLADGKVDEFESHFCNEICQAFALTPENITNAKQLAESGKL